MILLVLLLAQAAGPSPVPVAPGAIAAAAGSEASAKDVYARRCTICHGEDGKGRTRKGKQLRVPDFTTARWQKKAGDDQIVEIVQNGNKKRKMPAFKSKLTAEQIHALVPLLRGFSKQSHGEH